MKRKKIVLAIGLAITLFYSCCLFRNALPLERLELLFYDLRFQLRGKVSPPRDIVILAIDDKSIERIGRWPWERRRLAEIIDLLHEGGAKVILMDIICAERAPGDEQLRKAVAQAGNVLLPIVFTFNQEQRPRAIESETITKWAFPMIRDLENLKLFPPISAAGVLPTRDAVAAAASGLGHITMIPDRDGVLRWEIMAIEYQKEFYPSIDLQAARLFYGLPQEALILNATRGVQLGETFIPTDRRHRSLIHYYGPANTFPRISAADLLERKVEPSFFNGRIVLVGATATGLYDMRVTPASPLMPGIEKHANVVASVLEKKFPERTTKITSLLVLLASGIIFSLCLAPIGATVGAALAALFLCAMFFAGYLLFFSKGLWMDLGFSGFNLLSIYFVVTAFRFAMEERYARKIRGMFSSYVTERIVNELIRNPGLAKLGGSRREVTVLFSDVKSFTPFSERHSPEEVVSLLNEYLGEMAQVIFRWEGTLDKFIGDAILAFWGAPLAQEDHAERAVGCALEMIERLKKLQAKWMVEGKEGFDNGIGINTGEVLVGNIGAEGKKMDYTVIGDQVNLGSRVEGLTRKYGRHIIMTENTLDKLRVPIAEGRLRIRATGLDRVAVKGKEQPVALYAIAAASEDEGCAIVECASGETVRLKEK